MNPLISVIVPIYKVERYLVRCLDSIVNQTYRNLEIILVEDGSPDNCGAICDDYARLDERIRVIHQENRGLSAARNAGLDLMSGEYLMFVDSDDWISLDAVQVLYDRMMADGSDMVLGRYIKTFGGDGEEVISPQWMEDGCYSPSQLVMGMGERRYVPVSAWGKLYRYAYYEELRFPKLTHAEDLAIFPDILDRCTRISISEKVIYFYYQRSDSLMHAMNEEQRLDCLKATLKMVVYLKEKGYLSAQMGWFANAVYCAFECKDKHAAVSLMEGCFNQQEIRQQLTRQSWKVNLKWVALNHPCLSCCVQIAKKMIPR